MAPIVVACLLLFGTSFVHAQPITRSEAVHRALQYHIDVQEARSKVAEYEAVSGLSAIDLGRTSVLYTKGQYNSSLQDNNFTLEQTVPFPTVWFAKTSLASDLTNVARAELHLRERAVRVEVENLFERIRYLRAANDLLGGFDTLYARAVDVTKARERVGEGTKLASVSTESQRREIEVQRRQVGAELLSAEGRLKAVVGSDVTAASEDIAILDMAIDSTSELPIIAYQRAQAQAADGQSSVEHARIWPDITVGWFSQTLTGTPLAPNTLSGPTDRFTGFSVGLQIPLWFAPDAGRAQQASIAARTANERVQIGRRTIDLKRSTMRTELAASRSTLQYYQETALPEVELLVKQSTRAWESGEIGYLEHHTALTRALTVRTAYQSALHRYNLLLIDYTLFTTP